MERREARCFASAVALVGHEGCLAPLEFAKRILTPSQFAPANWLEQPSCVHRFVRGTVALMRCGSLPFPRGRWPMFLDVLSMRANARVRVSALCPRFRGRVTPLRASTRL